MIYFRNINDIDDYSEKEIWLIMRSVTGNLKKIAQYLNWLRQKNCIKISYYGRKI